jgi:hypothetical protein
MHRPVFFVALLTYLCSPAPASADTQDSLGLSAAARARVVRVVDEARQNRNITQKQREDTMRWIEKAPCRAVTKNLTSAQRDALARAIASQYGRGEVKILDYLEYKGWIVVSTDAKPGVTPYLFYSKSPVQGGKAITSWSGAATVFETQEMYEWTKAAVSRIPLSLAACFAWQVTLGP